MIPICLRRAQFELPLDLHDKASQIVIDDLEVMDEIRLFRHLAAVDEADDIDEQLNDLFADLRKDCPSMTAA